VVRHAQLEPDVWGEYAREPDHGGRMLGKADVGAGHLPSPIEPFGIALGGWRGRVLALKPVAVRGSLAAELRSGAGRNEKNGPATVLGAAGRRVCQRGTARKDFEPLKLTSLRGRVALIWIRAAIRP
jgi:hypothetical protein